jgi:hypothetical protein
LNQVFTPEAPNLNEMKIDQKLKFLTSADDMYLYSGYTYNNFSFCPQSQLNFNENYYLTSINPNPLFPFIPYNYKSGQLPIKNDINLEENLFSFDKNNLNIERDE